MGSTSSIRARRTTRFDASGMRRGAYFWFFHAEGSGAVEVVRRTFMNARVRTVRNSSGSTPGSALGFSAKKFSIVVGASSIVDPARACSSFARMPGGSALNVPLKLTDWIWLRPAPGTIVARTIPAFVGRSPVTLEPDVDKGASSAAEPTGDPNPSPVNYILYKRQESRFQSSFQEDWGILAGLAQGILIIIQLGAAPGGQPGLQLPGPIGMGGRRVGLFAGILRQVVERRPARVAVADQFEGRPHHAELRLPRRV